MFYSQQKEDEILFNKYLNYKNGFFIELGAMDGVRYSNTLFFEKSLNWTGVLIEAMEDQYQRLIRNRPLCHNFNYAVSEVDGFIDFYGGHDDAVGGIVKSMNEAHKKNWGFNNKAPYKIKSKPINKILKDITIKKVDLFSIDVEGAEIDVLNTFDWSIPVYIILIEMIDYGNEDGKNKCETARQILKEKGFEFDMTLGCNEVWINKKFNINK